MTDKIIKPEPLKQKLSLKKETLRILDDSKSKLLDAVAGGDTDCSGTRRPSAYGCQGEVIN